MKKLFTFLSGAHNNSVGINSNYRRVSSICPIRTFVVVFMIALAPSTIKGQITIDFNNAALGAYFHAQDPSNGKYNVEYVMGESYNTIGNGARIGNIINYKNSTSGSVDISRLAFTVNTNGAGNAHNTGYGFYLRRDPTSGVNKAGLYTGNGNSVFAVLNLKPGDKVKIKYAATSNIVYGGANIRIENYNQWCTQLDNQGSEKEVTVDINFIGDLRVKVNQGTIIQSITIVPGPRAQYQITTESNKTTFAFTQDGLLDENDYTIPYLQASFGNINDFLMVSGLKAEMHKSDWSETLETGGHNYHSRFEWAALDAMNDATSLIIEIIKQWAV